MLLDLPCRSSLVPVGSELKLKLDSHEFDIRIESGGVDELEIKVTPDHDVPIDMFRFDRENDDGRTIYSCATTSSKLIRGNITVTVPPRYFSIMAETGGNIHVEEMKEAKEAILSSKGGSISCGSISAERISLVSKGGSIMASKLQGSTCDIDSNSQEEVAGRVQVGKIAALQLAVDAGSNECKINSLISPAANVHAGGGIVGSINTLVNDEDGRANFRLSKPDCTMEIGGLDGSASICCSHGSTTTVQLNERARTITVQGDKNLPAKVNLNFTPSMGLVISTDSDGMTAIQRPAEMMVTQDDDQPNMFLVPPQVRDSEIPVCHAVLHSVFEVRLGYRSWAESFLSWTKPTGDARE